MFLDEKLKAIYESKIFDSETLSLKDTLFEGIKEIVNTCTTDLPDVREVGMEQFIIDLKRTNNSYKLFVKKHDVAGALREEAFEQLVWNQINADDSAPQFFKKLGWKVPKM